MSNASNLAALDCGTNTTRLLITDPEGNALAREMRNTRLGQGVDASGLLAAEAVERSLSALREFKSFMDANNVGRFRAVATSAARDAKNGAEFLADATEMLGGPLEVLTGDEEGRLSYLGAAGSEQAETSLVVDIGGGSTELVFGHRNEVVSATSLNIGCVRVSEQFFTGGPYPAEQIRTAMEYLDAQLASVDAPTDLGDDLQVIGVAGTITTLAALELELQAYEPGAVEGFAISASALTLRFAQLAAATPEALEAQAGMPPHRAEVIVAGAAVLMAVFARFNVGFCRVSEMDILDGIILSLSDLK